MARRTRPEAITVWYRGNRYTFDLERCRNCLPRWSVDGEPQTVEGLAEHIGVQPSTVAGFISGSRMSLSTTLKILGALGEVSRLAGDDPDDPCNGAAGTPAGRRPPLGDGHAGAANAGPGGQEIDR